MKRNSSHSTRELSSIERAKGFDSSKRHFSRGSSSTPNHRLSKRAKLEPSAPEFGKLNQSDPVHARRIQQRRKMVQFGKNTVGYDEYVKQVPIHKRRPRCMKHPMTPDHTLDIPTKRWQGLVKAWRRALHQYDPEDLMTTFNTEHAHAVTPIGEGATTQEREIAHATAQGLPVDLRRTMDEDMSHGNNKNGNNNEMPRSESSSPTSLNTEASSVVDQFRDQGMDELDAWEASASKEQEDFLLSDDDSDDELL